MIGTTIETRMKNDDDQDHDRDNDSWEAQHFRADDGTGSAVRYNLCLCTSLSRSSSRSLSNNRCPDLRLDLRRIAMQRRTTTHPTNEQSPANPGSATFRNRLSRRPNSCGPTRGSRHFAPDSSRHRIWRPAANGALYWSAMCSISCVRYAAPGIPRVRSCSGGRVPGWRWISSSGADAGLWRLRSRPGTKCALMIPRGSRSSCDTTLNVGWDWYSMAARTPNRLRKAWWPFLCRGCVRGDLTVHPRIGLMRPVATTKGIRPPVQVTSESAGQRQFLSPCLHLRLATFTALSCRRSKVASRRCRYWSTVMPSSIAESAKSAWRFLWRS